MTNEEQSKMPVLFIDNPHAPEVFASEASGFFFHNGNVHITFESPKADHSTPPGPVKRVVIARLIMPASGAQGLAVELYDFLKTKGFAPELTPPAKSIN